MSRIHPVSTIVGAPGLPGDERHPGLETVRFVLLGDVTNFAMLRRHVGVPRAAMLVNDVVARIAAAVPAARVVATGRASIEIDFNGTALSDGPLLLARVHASLAAPLDIDGESHGARIVFGGVATTAIEMDDIRLVEAAEQMLADARVAGSDIIRDLADPQFDHAPTELMRELPGAISGGQIFLQYQPKIHVRHQTVASAEALVRWCHPVRGLILPGDFIELAERHDAIAPLTLWTIERVLADQRALAARGHEFPIFINISGVLLSDARFIRDAEAILRGNGGRIGFEITETAVIRDPESAIANLKRFADIGVTLAIDDYGAGLSSLAYLKRLPASELKIDKLFVTQLTSSNRDPLIVRSTIDLAHALNMQVTAEGVETQAAFALLGVMGCDMVQGYLISRPLAIEAFTRFLDEGRHLDTIDSPRISFRRNDGMWRVG